MLSFSSLLKGKLCWSFLFLRKPRGSLRRCNGHSAGVVVSNLGAVSHPFATSQKADFQNGTETFPGKAEEQAKEVKVGQVTDVHYCWLNIGSVKFFVATRDGFSDRTYHGEPPLSVKMISKVSTL